MKTNINMMLACLFFIGMSIQSHAQFNSNREKLDAFSQQMLEKEASELAEAIEVANARGLSLEGIYKLDKNGNPMYNMRTNATAAATTGTAAMRTVYGVDGEGMKVGVWECCNDGANLGDVPLLTHQDLVGRVTIKDATPAANHSSHATHVTGTLIGAPPSGVSQQSQGMAYKATADAYGISSHTSEMAAAAATSIADVTAGKLLISNHSYGTVAGWYIADAPNNTGWTWAGGTATFVAGGQDPSFGNYGGTNSTATQWDQIAFDAPYYLICKSAGNDLNDGTTTGTVRNGSGPFVPYNASLHPGLDGANGASCVPTYSNAKNIMTVGAVNNSSTLSNFSSNGPTNDGRIKPDLCGVGVGVTSADNGSNTDYGSKNGTSMSGPQVAGSLLLLQEMYKDKFSFGSDILYMKATTLKALAINSATDQGNANPDYRYGFGVLNAAKASDFINQDAIADNTSTVVIIEDQIETASDEFEYEFDIVLSADMRVTLVYNDVPADSLVNDLDVKVVQLSTTGEIRPWKLDPANPTSAATRGDNDIDNVEHVSQNNLIAGTYRAVVSVDGSLYQNEAQAFSLVISGIESGCKASIQHKSRNLASGTYVAKDLVRSTASINPGAEVTYTTNGKVELKPGFIARAQSSTGAGFFKTAAGTCN